jgi:hypothetical protein
MYQSSKFQNLDDSNINPAQERIMDYVKNNCVPPSIFEWVHKWAHEWCESGYAFVSPCAKTVINRMQDKYKHLNGDPPNTIYKSIMDHLPSSPITSWDIKSQIRRILSDPTAVGKATWEFTAEADPISAKTLYFSPLLKMETAY